jgi:hypothetical protein
MILQNNFIINIGALHDIAVLTTALSIRSQ